MRIETTLIAELDMGKFDFHVVGLNKQSIC